MLRAFRTCDDRLLVTDVHSDMLNDVIKAAMEDGVSFDDLTVDEVVIELCEFETDDSFFLVEETKKLTCE